jgi:FKBP-type peptidyl-prolyl cis-trans isomerase (trigger factor)
MHLDVEIQPQFSIGHVHVVLPSSMVDEFYHQALQAQRHFPRPQGLHQQEAPLEYINQHYKIQILEHLKEFLLKYCVVSFLYHELRNQKVVCIGDPRLKKISINTGQDAYFTFEFTPILNSMTIRDWKYLPYHAPERKKYKDIDKQAEIFVEEERSLEKQYSVQDTVQIGDWIAFDLQLLDHNEKHVAKIPQQSFWLRISDEEASIPFQEMFVGRKKNDSFISTDECLQEYFSNCFDTEYKFLITLTDILPDKFFSIEDFKEHFKLKSNKKVQQKIIEVYSSRNDISLRRLMVEEAVGLVIKNYPCTIPHAAILRQQKALHDLLQMNPDYMVYKNEPDFLKKITMLAEKQITEVVFIDRFAYQENIRATHSDIKHYLNLTKRPRTKEFIYFLHHSIRSTDRDLPLSAEVLRQSCEREKTLNYILNNLNPL